MSTENLSNEFPSPLVLKGRGCRVRGFKKNNLSETPSPCTLSPTGVGERDISQTRSVVITPKRSEILLALIILNSLGALLVLWLSSFYFIGKLIISPALLIYSFYLIFHYCLGKTAHSIQQVRYAGNQDWNLYLKNGLIINGKLKNNSLITRYLIILNFKAGGYKFWRTYTLPLLPDSEITQKLREIRLFVHTTQ